MGFLKKSMRTKSVNGAENMDNWGGVILAHLYYARDSSGGCDFHPAPTRPPVGWSNG